MGEANPHPLFWTVVLMINLDKIATHLEHYWKSGTFYFSCIYLSNG